MKREIPPDGLMYHASRLLLLIYWCGRPQDKTAVILPGIEGRTLLAKLDFFLRYPYYLRQASKITQLKVSNEDLGLENDIEEKSVETRMIRYLYGPWDSIYYPVLAYLIGKGLIEINKKNGRSTEIFRLTLEGYEIAKEISQDSAYMDLTKRARTVYHAFNKYNGNSLKDFIYKNFPEVVSRKIGFKI